MCSTHVSTYKPLHLREDPFLGFFDVLLPSNDLDIVVSRDTTHTRIRNINLDFGLLMSRCLLFLALLLLLIYLVGEVELDAKLVAELVYAGPLCTDDTTDELPIDFELDRLPKKG